LVIPAHNGLAHDAKQPFNGSNRRGFIMRTTFFTYFTSAYGTIWLAMFALAFVTQSHIDTGVIGLLGFPIIALIYAFYRRRSDSFKLSRSVRPDFFSRS
jgi:hypothetical protein